MGPVAHKGVTMIELVVTIGIASIVSAMAYPSMRSLIVNNDIAAVSSQMVATMNLARLEAVRRVATTRVITKSDEEGNWADGYTVLKVIENNEQAIRQVAAFNSSFIASSDSSEVRFDSRGFANEEHSITICDQTDDTITGRQLLIEASGHIVASEHDCSS